MTYIVYRYDFPDGTCYIGRTSLEQNRYNNPKKYEGQEVYKHLITTDYKATILYRTVNPFLCCAMEHRLIKKYYYNSHNGSIEKDWAMNALSLYNKEYSLYDPILMVFLKELYDYFPEED